MIGALDNVYGTGFAVDHVAAEHVLDFTFQWQINDTVGLTLGVENILNNKPPLMGIFFSSESNTDTSVFNAQILGPRLFGRISANF